MPVKIELNKNSGNGFKPVKMYTCDTENEAFAQLKKIFFIILVQLHSLVLQFYLNHFYLNH